jgi:hypothetical protein
MVLFVMPKPLAVGQTYSDPVKFGLQGFVVAGVPTTGKPLKLIFWLISSIGMSKLAVLVKLKASKVNFREERSVIGVSFTSEMSPASARIAGKYCVGHGR